MTDVSAGSGCRACPDTVRNGKLWQRNYWNVIVRNYEAVRCCGEPRLLGSAELLKLPKVGFLASRGETSPHGHLPTKKGEAIISGFLSPIERAVFKAGLVQKRPLIWVKLWGFGTPDRIEQEALDAGLLLIVSSFADISDAPSVQRAAWCSEYVLAQYDCLIVGHLSHNGMLACILSEKTPDLEITFLCPTPQPTLY